MVKNLIELKQEFSEHVYQLQDQITAALKEVDPSIELKEDLWSRKDFQGEDGGGGRSRYFHGEVIESAGVNVSKVYGAVDPEFSKSLGRESNKMWASGISLIIHPKNPKVPTVHANFRMIHHGDGDNFWFGGGADLTPFYPIEEDFIYFHQVWKDACSPYGHYDEFKKWCDEYFVNHHRNGEMRGIGGVFFDRYRRSENAQDDYNMTVDLSNHFINSYFPIVKKRKDELYTNKDEDFQLHRRGRYVEFNLLHDIGTKFGLQTNGRTESILISLPPRCKFTYCYHPEEGQVHSKMMEYYRPHKWV